ncbi:Flavonoid 3'-monooxygenase [Porphyridium purpureum]|uniref:Flavonoid 3'-monooxygenase n=1 Tax=Porphyridium purpureum TaxID=35688 RepID=A0A5J4YQF0_PORPP|nr:Flavonoid 3'-monooxygenase [Porphyridium purpureum]|eukprot:POR7172..scf236_6
MFLFHQRSSWSFRPLKIDLAQHAGLFRNCCTRHWLSLVRFRLGHGPRVTVLDVAGQRQVVVPIDRSCPHVDVHVFQFARRRHEVKAEGERAGNETEAQDGLPGPPLTKCRHIEMDGEKSVGALQSELETMQACPGKDGLFADATLSFVSDPEALVERQRAEYAGAAVVKMRLIASPTVLTLNYAAAREALSAEQLDSAPFLNLLLADLVGDTLLTLPHKDPQHQKLQMAAKGALDAAAHAAVHEPSTKIRFEAALSHQDTKQSLNMYEFAKEPVQEALLDLIIGAMHLSERTSLRGLLSDHFKAASAPRIPFAASLFGARFETQYSKGVRAKDELTQGVFMACLMRENEALAKAGAPQCNMKCGAVLCALAGSGLEGPEITYLLLLLTSAFIPKTIASLVSFCLLELCLNPELMHKVRVEMEENEQADDHASSAVQLPFLEACIQEAVRLHPPVFACPRSSSGALTLQDHSCPRKSRVLAVIPAANKDPAVYGPDAGAFRPDRWLSSAGGSASSALATPAPLSFGSGHRFCVGEDLARTLTKLFIVSVLRAYGNVRLAHGAMQQRPSSKYLPVKQALVPFELSN